MKKMKIVFVGFLIYMIMIIIFYLFVFFFVRGVDENWVGYILIIKFRNEGFVFDFDVFYLGEFCCYISFDRLKIDF